MHKQFKREKSLFIIGDKMKEKIVVLFLKLAGWASNNIVISEDSLIDFIKSCDYDKDGYISLSEFIKRIKIFIGRKKLV